MEDPTSFASDPARIARLLGATEATVASELRALGADGAAWRPAPGEWCANEVVGHLAEAERRGFAGRIRLILDEANPALEDWDEPAVAAARGDCAKPVEDLLAEFLPLRAHSIALVQRLTRADLARRGRHPAVGDLTVEMLLAEWVHHDRNHVRQLLAIGQGLAWPAMGNARRFSDPNA